jgi:hypothetical protein
MGVLDKLKEAEDYVKGIREHYEIHLSDESPDVDKSSLEDFLFSFFDNSGMWASQTISKNIGGLKCFNSYYYYRRSINDTYNLVLTYFPEVTMLEFLTVLLTEKRKEHRIRGWYCSEADGFVMWKEHQSEDIAVDAYDELGFEIDDDGRMIDEARSLFGDLTMEEAADILAATKEYINQNKTTV